MNLTMNSLSIYLIKFDFQFQGLASPSHSLDYQQLVTSVEITFQFSILYFTERLFSF